MTINELIGKSCFDLIPESLAESRKKITGQVIETGPPVRVLDERDGRHIDTRLYPVFNGLDDHLKISYLCRDGIESCSLL